MAPSDPRASAVSTDSDGVKPKIEDGHDADAVAEAASGEDVAMTDAPAPATKKTSTGSGGKGRRTANKGGGKRRVAAEAARAGGGGRARKKKASTASSPTPHVKREPGLTPSSGSDRDNEEDADADADDDGDDDDGASDNGPYCICRGPDDHRWMIQCDHCEDWFHGDCVHLDKEEGESLIVSYICPNCVLPDQYVTRFRKLCPLPGCRRPARLYAAADGAVVAAAPDDAASAFCSDAHRDQWWEALLERMVKGDALAPPQPLQPQQPEPEPQAASEDKMSVDQLTPAQLIAVLARSNEPGVAQMLLYGSVQDSIADTDAQLAEEERQITRASAADRYHLGEQIVMCKKMLQLLDMAKTRHQEATKDGHLERDGCGYDERLQHVGVQPHFSRFLGSPEGQCIFRATDNGNGNSNGSDNDSYSDSDSGRGGGGRRRSKRRLGPPRFDDTGAPVGSADMTDEASTDAADAADASSQATAGMCGRRKCKAHAGWFPTLARDVRMQIQECTRQAAALRAKETRIRAAAVQRAFVMRHSQSEVRRFPRNRGGGGGSGRSGRSRQPRQPRRSPADADDDDLSSLTSHDTSPDSKGKAHTDRS